MISVRVEGGGDKRAKTVGGRLRKYGIGITEYEAVVGVNEKGSIRE